MRPGEHFQTDVPNRLDRLPWSKWHWRVVIGLGVTWVLDGLEVTLAGAIGAVLTKSLHMSDTQVGISATFYLIGAVIGAIGFGYATVIFFVASCAARKFQRTRCLPARSLQSCVLARCAPSGVLCILGATFARAWSCLFCGLAGSVERVFASELSDDCRIIGSLFPSGRSAAW